MKKKVIIGIIIGVIVLVAIAGGVGYLFINDSMQKAKIMQTFSELEEITASGDFDMEAINENTSNIVSSGKYANVERAAKNYAHDLFSTAFELKELLQDDKMAQLLTASNYSEDGPEFVESKKYVSETKQTLEAGKEKLVVFLEEGKINSYIEAETDDAYCKELYRQLLTDDIEMSETEKKEFEKSINQVVSMLDVVDDVFDFLIENKGKWEVQGEQVLFNSNSLVIKYNSFLTKLRTL